MDPILEQKERMISPSVFNNISLFTGAMGLDLGLEKAGFKTVVAVEMDHRCADTIRFNRPGIHVIEKDIRLVSTREILESAGLRKGEVDLVSGGPPCQPFSTVGKRESIRDSRGQAFLEFLRVIEEARPKFFVIENVKGILSSALRHRPLHRRGRGAPTLRADERPGSTVKFLLSEFDRLGYKVIYGLANAADYGVPQIRERVFFIGTRDQVELHFPEPTHSKDASNGKSRWLTLADALAGLNEGEPLAMSIPKSRTKYLKQIPPGGNWKDLPVRLQKKAMGLAYYSGGGKTGYFRRLSFSNPAPTLVTSPVCRATSLIHPTLLRPLSIKEYARVQQFPDNWILQGGLHSQYQQVGNAVPVGLGYAFGKILHSHLSKQVMVISPSKHQ